jgi:hypothetical protein
MEKDARKGVRARVHRYSMSNQSGNEWPAEVRGGMMPASEYGLNSTL